MSTSPRLIGKYELQERLGRGGMGEVWKAFDTQLLRHVAFKLIRTELRSDPYFVTRFQREAQAIASLHHPNIVKIFDFQISQSSESDNTIYMVMDYIEGQTLGQYIRNTARVSKFPSAADLVHLFVPISTAIDYAHHKGMIHRDIKPANILLDKRLSDSKSHLGSRNPIGEPILTDFGVAKLLGGATNTLSAWWFGTPQYTSPEQARGSPGNERSDIYSLGIILYEICTGVLPFNGDSPVAILMQHINATPTSPVLINPNISPALAMVILRSIAKDPADRFPSAVSMATALCEALDIPIPENLRPATQPPEVINEPTQLRPGRPSQPMNAIPSVPLQPPPVQAWLLTPPNTSPVAGTSGATPTVYSASNTPAIPMSPLPIQSGPHPPMPQGIVEGEDLERRMERLNQPMEARDVLLYASQVLTILDYFGRQTPPIVHGEIQPANIIIGARDKRAHLVGFGTAKDEARNKQEKLTLGLPGYAPIEQLRGNTDPRSDLYALAATMHYLLTNRNPRNHPPFVYPPVRLSNPQISSEVERVLTHALMNNITHRYQNAAEMKRDIDDILLRHYGIPGDISNYTQSMSGPTGVVDPRSAANIPTVTYQPASIPQQPSAPQTVSVASTGSQPAWQRWQRSKWMHSIIPIGLVILLITAGLSFLLPIPHNAQSANSTQNTPTIALPDGIGVTRAPNGDYIGISDGTFAFDTHRPDGNLKTQAAEQLKAHDYGSADSLWQQAVTEDTNDAETLIYMEDRRIMDSGDPYITIVVGTTLSGNSDFMAAGYGATRAAYVAQRQYNTASKLPGGIKVRLLIASSGGVPTYATSVAQQIVQLAQKDKTIVAVMGWTSTATTLNAITVLSPAKIPMVTNVGADQLTSRSPYFFRVVPPASVQGQAGAVYAEQRFHPRTAAVFFDEKNDFILSQAKGFTSRFTSDGNTIVATELYTVGKPGTLPTLLQDALSKHPDIIYFAGFSGDSGGILGHLQPSDPPVLGASSLYQMAFPAEARSGLTHLSFTAYGYPDEWDILGLSARKPSFFADYQADFDPNNQHSTSPYGYARPDGRTMELYDAISVLLYGCSIALTESPTLTRNGLQHALTEVNGSRAFQGVSSQISFGSDNNPIDRAIVFVCLSREGFFKMDGIYGKFLIGEAYRHEIFTPSACS